jgi:hypothetical protein
VPSSITVSWSARTFRACTGHNPRALTCGDRARDQGTQLARRRLEDTDAKKVAASAATAIRHFSELLIAVRIALRLTPEIWAVSEQPAWRSLLVPGRPPWKVAGGAPRHGAMRPVNSMSAVALPGWRPSPRRRQCQSFIRG